MNRPNQILISLVLLAIVASGQWFGQAFAAQAQTDSAILVDEPDIEQLSAPVQQGAQAFTKAPDGRLEFHARNLDIVSVLTQLRLIEQRNIVVSNKVSGTVSADLYGVSFEDALQAILRAGNLVALRERAFIYVCTPEEMKDRIAAQRQMTTHIFNLYYASAPEVVKLLGPLASKEGYLATTSASDKGIAANQEAAGGNDFAAVDTIVVQDYPENIEQMKKVVAKVDVRPKQVLIEATILAASLHDDTSLGIDFNVLAGVDFENLSSTSTGGTSLTTGSVPSAELSEGTLAVETGFIAGLGLPAAAGGLNIGIIKNDIALFIHALEQITDTTVLANPKVLVLNKQRGEVMVGRRDGYLTSTTTETSTIETVEFLETGTRLIFRPYIGNDGYVRLEIHPEDSTGGLSAAGLPFEETAEVTTNVLVKDGSTIVIGGLFRDFMTVKRGQVPWFGNIPWLGAAFRRTRDDTIKQEVVILLTPHIVDDPQDEEEYSRQMSADAETYRVGMRQGLRWFGRTRLAQAHYRAAQKYLQQGRKAKAMWELSAAINLSPDFLEAIRMREELLGEKLAEPARSAVKDLVAKRVGESSQITDQPEAKGTK